MLRREKKKTRLRDPRSWHRQSDRFGKSGDCMSHKTSLLPDATATTGQLPSV